MLDQETLTKIRAMRLPGMANALETQHHDTHYATLSFEERLGLVIDAEWLYRQNQSLSARLGKAKLKISAACLENLDQSPKRNLDGAQIRQLKSGKWIEAHHNVIISGKTGSGKTPRTKKHDKARMVVAGMMNGATPQSSRQRARGADSRRAETCIKEQPDTNMFRTTRRAAPDLGPHLRLRRNDSVEM